MTEPIKMTGIISAEMQHELDAFKTELKLRGYWQKWRDEGILPPRREK